MCCLEGGTNGPDNFERHNEGWLYPCACCRWICDAILRSFGLDQVFCSHIVRTHNLFGILLWYHVASMIWDKATNFLERALQCMSIILMDVHCLLSYSVMLIAIMRSSTNGEMLRLDVTVFIK